MKWFRKEDRDWAEEVYGKICLKMRAEAERVGTDIPYIPENGRYKDMGKEGIHWWINGFWPGMLWQMYHATGEEIYKNTARGVEKRLDEALNHYSGLDHDVGFMWLHASVADYRLTGDEEAKERGLKAAGVLASRYNPAGRYISAWNGNRPGHMIIDCLMNLPLLYWASEQTGDPRFTLVAENHTDTALKYIVRPDGSCNHIVVMDPLTGEYLDNPGGQGYGQGSSWSRGQAWAVYGFALAYKYTGKPEYLDASKRVAHYFLANAALTDYVPLLDFRAPEEPVYYDTTAGVIAACGLILLTELVDSLEKNLYGQGAVRLLRAIEEKHCSWKTEEDGIVDFGSAKYHREADREVPIIYGDYFFIEGILRMTDRDFLIW
ncbi:MAG: glycoside hydrolase family 88 protein [Lachnospiraceae bacterium]|nr:glycoside hydrolase family 88 protein [Lachnospiraceae bacterium]